MNKFINTLLKFATLYFTGCNLYSTQRPLNGTVNICETSRIKCNECAFNKSSKTVKSSADVIKILEKS